MEVLIAGNSQAACLMTALTSKLFPRDAGVTFNFNVIPGGAGPNFAIEDGRLHIVEHDSNNLPYSSPAGVTTRQISEFDAIVVSALGFVDGGFAYRNRLIFDVLLAEFGPRPGLADVPMVSISCFRDLVAAALERHSGVQFLRRLSKQYAGRIIVQPFPFLSDMLLDREDWFVRARHADAIGFHTLLNSTRDIYLENLCRETGATLLPRPDLEARHAAFTPAILISDRDGMHPKAEYGAMVLDIIRRNVLLA